MTTVVAFSISPMGVGDSVSEPVAEAVRIVRESGLPNETNAMFTNIEGEWDEVMGVIKQCLDAMTAHSPRIGLVIKVDHRPGAEPGALQRKVEAVDRRLPQRPSW